MTERKVNDIGGLPAGPVCQDEHPNTLHEKRVDALLRLLSGPKLEAFTVDAMRRAIESNTEEDYRNLGYYDKWIRAVRDLVIEQQVLSRDEIETRVEQLRAKHNKVAA
jgi:protein-tyrosine phosphatase